MSFIRPFRALRPLPELAGTIAELPYDVYDSQEARVLIEKNPLSFIRVSKAEATLPENVPDGDPRIYEAARKNLEEYIAKGQLKQDNAPCYYIYRQQMGQYIQIGLVAAASVDEYKKNIIKKHELTRVDKETDRVNHIMATKAQTGPVFLAYRSKGLLNALLLKYMSNHKPVYDFTSSDNIKHTLYVVDDPVRIGEITELFKQVPQLYIADGHHRCAAALRTAEALAKRPNQTGNEEYNYFLAVIFPDTMLHILPYNRAVTDLNGLSVAEFFKAVDKKFTIDLQEHEPTPKKIHTFGMFVAGRWFTLTPREGTFKADDPIESLDVSILQNNLLAPILGIGDPRTDKRISFVGGIKGIGKLEELVSDGKDAVTFAMYPTTMDQLMTVADRGLIMPPKSTWFEPKLRDAMTIHLIGDEQDGKSI
jgi:uncharacterized protein (DUF1015 family)